MFEPILTRNIGVADSEKIATYLARGGYEATRVALTRHYAGRADRHGQAVGAARTGWGGLSGRDEVGLHADRPDDPQDRGGQHR